jgi:hypothetical protein
VAASGLRPSGVQWHKRTGPHQTGSGYVSSPDPRLGHVQGSCMFCSWDLAVRGLDPAQGGVRGPSQGSRHARGGSRSYSEVWSISTGVWHFPMGVRTHC